MSKQDILMLYPQRPNAMAQLEEAYNVHRWDLAADKDAFLAEFGPRCRAIATNGHAPMTRQIIEAMPDLEVVASSSAGFDGFDIGAMAERNIALTNTSVALCDDVADVAIMLLLSARRSLVKAHQYVVSGEWGVKGMFPLQTSLKGKRLGIVGLGTIGQAIGRRAEAMGQDICYWNRRKKDVAWTFEPDLLQLAKDVDNLVVIVAGGPETQHLISREVMEALGPQGLLINVARGSVVDEEALISCLASGALGHAALDVYDNEPNPNPALTSLSSVTLFPHHASGTVETRDAMAQLVVDNLAAFFAGEALLTPVDLASQISTKEVI